MGLRILYIRGKRAKWLPLLAASHRLEVEVGEVYGSGLSGGRIAALGRLDSAVRRFLPQVLVAEYSGLNHLGLLPLCAAHCLPLVLGVKGDPWREAEDRRHLSSAAARSQQRLQLWSSVMLMRRARLLLPLTQALQATLHRHLGSPSTRVVPIPFTEPDREGPTASAEPFVLTVTNFRFWAKVAPLVAAAPRVAAALRTLGLQWRILGDGPFLQLVRDQLAGLAGITFHGQRDPQPFYRGARLFLYPSGLDGLPNAILEAALHELPVVVQRNTPSAELIVDGETGAIADLDSAEAEQTLHRLASDSERRRQLGRAAEAWVRRTYAPAVVATELEAALTSVA